MKTKVSSDNNGEGVPPQTTVVTTTVGQSSVWSICDISTDSHVELRDITPSISPVFTDDQVHELTQNSSEVDVLGEHFLPPEAIKQIDEVLSSQAQGNLLYSDPVLGNALKQNHDVLLPGDLGFHGTMFPSFDSIVEADRILNKRDESADAISSEGNDTAADQTSSAVWSKDGTAVNTPAGDSGTDGGDSSGTEKGPRRSMRKRVQVKKDSETLKTVLPASKPVSRGKDISKLKYANNKEEAPKKEVRRSGRMQKKVDKGENSADTEEKESNVNSEKQNITIDKEAEMETLEQQDSASKNVRRSPRTQKKSPVEEKKNTSRKQDDKKEANTSSDGKESCEEKASDKESKSKGTKSKGSEKTNKKGSNDGDVTGSDKDEKKGVRKSGRTTRQKNEEEEKKVDNENNKEDAKKGKGKTEGKKIEEAKNIEDSEIKVTEKNLSEKDESKKGANKSVADEKPEKSDNPRTQGKEEDSKTKAIGRKKVELKTESSEDESVVKTRRVSRRNERQERKDTEENIAGKSSEEETKSAASLKENAVEAQDTIKQEDKADKESSDEKENIKKVVQEEVTTSAVKDEKASKESKKVGKKVSSGDVEQSKEEEDGDSDENSVDDNEEFNEDSDYDPEYDPDRLWCVCRKPHGNRFMICCDHCEDWFHGMCVGITMAQGRQMEKDGQEYVCPKCQAKVEEEMKEKNKETKPKTENVAKGKEETYKHSEAKEGRKSPSKHGHHKRKEHSVKIKIPFEKDDTRKRRHSTHRRSQDDEHSGSKKSKESDRPFTKEHTSEEKKKKQPESKGFRIPKKVRTTPTPASYIHHPTRKMCITAGCSMLAEHYSLYCSPECVQKHAEESLKIILDEKKKRMGYKQPVSSSKNVVSPTSSLLGPVPWDHNPAPNLSQSESAPKEGIAVIERSTGRVIAGVAAPTQEELLYWLQDHPTFEVLRPAGAKDDKKKEKKEDSEKSIRDNIRKSLKDILTLRSKEQQDLSVSEEKIIKCSLDVEGEMFSFFGDTGHRYKNKYRSLMFNLKDPRNKVLFRHVLLGEITVDRLVRMTPEQLASPELATWREQETKHTLEMIKQNQEEINATKAHTKKTHKGEVEIDDDDLSTLENSVKANAELKEEQKLPDSNTGSSSLLLDTTDEHRMHLFDLNCRICTGKMLPPGEPPRRETPSPLVSTTSIVQAVAESSIPSPTPMDIVTSANSPDSATVSQPPVSPSVLNKTTKKVPAVWKGFVMMQSVAKFGTSAYCVSGSCDDLLQLLPDTLHIQGRIAHEQVWDYLLQLKSSTSREVCVIRYEASSDDEKLSYVSLYSYFYSRKRCGVVSNCYTGVKDMYLVPLASHQPIPPELLPFDGPGLDEPRPHMLLGVIVRSKAVFKRPRALSQRSMSPPPKRRTSSASVETNSSDGGVSDSPASKRETLRELRDSPPADIDDIVFQYHTSQAKKTASESKDSSVKASPASESSTPSVSSSTGISSAVSNEKSSLPSLEAQKQQLLDLQERARQYILAQTQKKTASSNGKQGVEKEQSGSLEVVSVDQQAGVGGTADDDAPYDPEEGLDLDLTDITPSKPSVTTEPVDPVKPLEPAKPLEPTKSVNTATPVDSAKPSSLEILVSTLQRLQGTAPQLSAASAFLPKASISILQPMNPAAREHQSSSSSDIVSHSSTTSGHGQAKSEELSIPHLPVATAGRLHSSSVSSAQGPHFSPSSDHRLYPGLQPGPSSNQRLHPAPSSDQRPQLRNASDQRVQPGPTDHRPQPGPTVDQRLHPAPSSDQRPQSRHPSDQRVQPGPTDHRPKPGPTVDQRPQPRHPSDQRVQPGPTDHRPQPGHIVDQRLQHGNSSDQRAPFGPSTDQRTQPHPDRWNPSEPPQVTRQVNNVTQDVEQYSGLRPEERARLAARESRLGSRENRRVSSDHRDPHYDQRRIDDRHRPGWHNDPRYHRDSRDSRDDSRRNWRDDYRQGRPWYSDEQRRDRHDHPPRHEDRREERRFKEHWNRDRWRR